MKIRFQFVIEFDRRWPQEPAAEQPDEPAGGGRDLGIATEIPTYDEQPRIGFAMPAPATDDTHNRGSKP